MPSLTREQLGILILKLPEPQRSIATSKFIQLYANKLDPNDYITYSNNLAGWIQKRLHSYLWSKQKEIVKAIESNRRVAVKACHSPGKSFLVARIICAWICCHPAGSARIITSASTFAQVKAVLWHEISRAHSEGKLPGRLNQTEWWLPIEGREELVAVGRRPADNNPSALHGMHEKFVLVAFDESCGIGAPLWEAGDSLLSNQHSRMLAVGNPDDPTTEFANVCKPGSGWEVITISAFDTPNFTGEECPQDVKDKLVSQLWVEEKRKKWGEGSPFWKSKVLGEFPDTRADALIPLSYIRKVEERSKERLELLSSGSTSTLPLSPIELGVDVGGGSNRNTICLRRGPIASIIHRDNEANTMSLLEKVIHHIRLTNASIAKVDYIGIGHGVVDRAIEISSDQSLRFEDMKSKSFGKSKDGLPYHCTYQQAASRIVGVEVGRPCSGLDSEQYVNLRAKGYWNLRERFEEMSIYLDKEGESANGAHEDLLGQLSALTYRSRSGRVQIEEKSEMKKRLKGGSPDEADSLMLAFLDASIESSEVGEEFSYVF